MEHVLKGYAAVQSELPAESPSSSATILVIDDDRERFCFLERALRKEFTGRIQYVGNPFEAEAAFVQHRPDLVVLDMHMPPFRELEVLFTLLAAKDRQDFIPIVGLTADSSQTLREKALRAGVTDFVSEPFEMSELVLRIDAQLRVRRMHLELTEARNRLEVRVQERTLELESLQMELLERLALAGEYRDDDTGGHMRRVGTLVTAIAREMGLPYEEAIVAGRASLLHDIGKIGLPDLILRKPGRLTSEEIVEMRKHTSIGRRILQGSRSRLLQVAESIAYFHHERWDGGGYKGVVGTEIPLEARIVAVADVFDALTSERPYKEAWPREQAIKEILRGSGTQFDPAVVCAFISVFARLKEGAELNDTEIESDGQLQLTLGFAHERDFKVTAEAS